MSNQIAWLLKVEVKESIKFRALMAEMFDATKNELGVIAYEWHQNKEETICLLYERYMSDAAVATHLETFARFAERFLEVSTPLEFTVFGNPSIDTVKALEGFTPAYWKLTRGFNRFS